MKEKIVEAAYYAIDEIAKKFASDRVRIKLRKDFYPLFLSKLSRIGTIPIDMSERSAYAILRGLTILEEDPDKPRTFILYKHKWRKFFKNYLEQKHK